MVHPCFKCGRYVRSNETRCPFCESAIEAASDQDLAPESMRLSRAALLVATSFTLAGCPFAARYGGPPPGSVPPADPPAVTAPTNAPSSASDAQVAPPKR